MISGICIVIVLIGFGLVATYMYGVHKFISDAEKDGPSGGDSSHSHH